IFSHRLSATPTGKPLIGASRAADNLWLNIGQGALGFTLACGSAALLTAQMSGLELPIDATPFTPDPRRACPRTGTGTR
ncbi:D-amino acid dehydrogenase small subunit, partial [Bordetella pertussis]